MNIFKMLGALKDMSKMREEMAGIAAEMANLEFTGRAGGDMVVVKANGAQEVVSISIDPNLLLESEKELLEDLLVESINNALLQARKSTAEIMQRKMSERLNMPELEGLMSQFLPK